MDENKVPTSLHAICSYELDSKSGLRIEVFITLELAIEWATKMSEYYRQQLENEGYVAYIDQSEMESKSIFTIQGYDKSRLKGVKDRSYINSDYTYIIDYAIKNVWYDQTPDDESQRYTF